MGQFYTTNYKQILDGLSIPDNVNYIIEPFAGSGDLLKFLTDDNERYGDIAVECYDIDPKQSYIKQRDTIKEPPIYKNKFVLTNPPFLARNKSKNKTLYDKYSVNDLYKCFIKELITNSPNGGIIIIPLNFWCSIRKSDIELKRAFLTKFKVIRVNVFEMRVFDDTTSAISCFQFMLKKNKENKENDEIQFMIYPSLAYFDISFNESNNYLIGGEIYKLPQNNNIKIDRLTKRNYESKKRFITNIFVKCLDDSYESQISMKIVGDDELYVDNTEKLTARSFATLVIEPEISMKKQQKLVKEFNSYLTGMREKYNSL